MSEFTGERLIPGEVDIDLLNEHMARYTFASRLAGGKRVLDAGCGAGYGSAELARVAMRVTGADIASEAVAFARDHYSQRNVCFEQASCTALPHPDASFDLVVAFEVIEHLADWRGLLLEARRLLAPGGQFVVSTPNRLYYTESRGAEGANPFHVHEFDFDEFRAELAAVFPHVALFLENHVEGVAFQPCPAGTTSEVRVDAGESNPAESHFFVAVCAHRPQIGNPTFVYVPRAANVLRERERHIALLQQEVATKNQWLSDAQAQHEQLLQQHRQVTDELRRSNEWAESVKGELQQLHGKYSDLTQELQRSNEWAQSLDRELAERRARIVEVQEELAAVAQGYAAKVAELDSELASRTGEIQKLQAALQVLQAQVNGFKASRWVKLGQAIGLGPEQSAR